MSILKNNLGLQNEVCYHGNQHAAVLVSCKNTEEAVLAYDPIHLDYINALTKWIDKTNRCAHYCYPTHFSL